MKKWWCASRVKILVLYFMKATKNRIYRLIVLRRKTPHRLCINEWKLSLLNISALELSIARTHGAKTQSREAFYKHELPGESAVWKQQHECFYHQQLGLESVGKTVLQKMNFTSTVEHVWFSAMISINGPPLGHLPPAGLCRYCSPPITSWLLPPEMCLHPLNRPTRTTVHEPSTWRNHRTTVTIQ